jgi:hypothetical protein
MFMVIFDLHVMITVICELVVMIMVVFKMYVMLTLSLIPRPSKNNLYNVS